MAFVALTAGEVDADSPITATLMGKVRDNFDALNAAILGNSNADVPNGSFEIDSDANGIADNWDQNLYPGGSATLDTTDQRSSLTSLKFTSPGGSGNGGGYYDSDYVPCNVLRPINLRFSHKSSAAGIHNQVILRWFTSAKVYVSATTIYDDTSTNPTSWTQFIRGAVPPSTACFFKVRLVGANSDDATAGSAWFDEVGLVGGVNAIVGYTNAVNAYSTTTGFDRIYIAGSLAGTTMGVSSNPFGAAVNIAGGSVAITARDSGANVQGTLTLTLPEGRWTIFAVSESALQSADPDVYHHSICAIALREG